MEYPVHQPVLYHEIILALNPISAGRYVDGTLGAGGHARGILNTSSPDGILLGLDLDPVALALAKKNLASFGDRMIIKKASFSTLTDQLGQLGWSEIDGMLLDLGASSMQFDTPDRGFSFQTSGDLDMRFDPTNPLTASILVNESSESELASILSHYGEEPHSRRIARAIVATRPITNTLHLAEVIRSTNPVREKIHPATRTFQALRIAVNDELLSLERVLPQAIRSLKIGGRLAVISFHSLEDRIVKKFFRQESKDCICPPRQPVCTCDHQASVREINHRPYLATKEEIEINPRSRSAKLRVAEKIH